MFTIENFWKACLPISNLDLTGSVKGWSFVRKGLDTFKEAPLALSSALSAEQNPQTSPILLVSAPGAVGKTILARQIAFATGSLYVDLGAAEEVGGNTISGGLAKSGLYEHWQNQTVGLLIDGLDEARLRVTQGAYEAFLADIVHLAQGRKVPTVLFGRSGAVQDAWLSMSDGPAQMAVLEIGYYGPEAALDFADARVRSEKKDSPHAGVDRRALEVLLGRLREQTEADGDRFAGYAPVLLAVAERVIREGNPAALIAQLEKGAEPVTLQTVVTSILERERGKLDPLNFEDEALKEKLYLPQEQMERLMARVYNLSMPDLVPMGPNDARSYSTALETWVTDHPFLHEGRVPSSAVFDAAIAVLALRTPRAADQAAVRELRRGAANPFLSEFYLSESLSNRQHLPPEHVGIVYGSMRARLSLGDTASLLVSGPDDEGEEDLEALKAEVEITVARRDTDRPRILEFDTEQTGSFKFGNHIEDVDISVEYAKVEMGFGRDALFVAPVNIQCRDLLIHAEKIIAECPAGMTGAAVFLEAERFEGQNIMSVPVIRGDVSFKVSWPGAEAHPWTSFATAPSQVEDPRLDEALRRFRKFVIAFRSHSKGNLGRYRRKLEHERMTKGSGAAVLNLLKEKGILTLRDTQYILDPDKLGALSGATYSATMVRQFSEKTMTFVKLALPD